MVGYTCLAPDSRTLTAADGMRKELILEPNSPTGSNPRYITYRANNAAVLHFPMIGKIRNDLTRSVQVIPFQDAANNWPSVTYAIQMSIDGLNWQALPTPITGVAITNTPGTIHFIGWSCPYYRVVVTFGSGNGRIAVLTDD